MAGSLNRRRRDRIVRGIQGVRALFGEMAGGKKAPGEKARVELLDTRVLFDTVGPTASAFETIGSEQTTATFTVTYSDFDGVDASTIGTGDIIVSGANGFSQVATFVSATEPGVTVEATFQVTGPAGIFNRAVNGDFTISAPANAVADALGNLSAENPFVGLLKVAIPLSIKSTVGPITQVNVGDGLDFQVKHAQFAAGQFFPPNDALATAGLLVRLPDPEFPTEMRTYGFQGQSYTPVSQTLSQDGLTVTNVVEVGGTLRITSVTTYQPGNPFFSVQNTVSNLTGGPVTFDLFFAADLYLADNDLGVGFFNPDTLAVGGTSQSGEYNIFFQADTTFGPQITNYEEGRYTDVLNKPTTDTEHFSNTVKTPTTQPPYSSTDPAYEDNGAGIEWASQTIAAGGEARFGLFAAFGNVTVIGGSVTGTLGNVASPQYGDLTVVVPVTYSASGGVNPASLGDDDITVTGPGGFTTTATFLSFDNAGTAFYSVASPAGGFLDTNAGTYTVTLNSGAVTALGGGQSSTTTLGSFSSSPLKPRIGGPDPTFGVNGVVVVTVPSTTLVTLDSFSNTDGTILTAAFDATSGTLLLTRILANGQLDTSFGSGGISQSALPADFTPQRVQFDGVSSHIYLLGITASTGQPTVASYNFNGSVQGDFGNGGVLAIAGFQSGDRLETFVAVPDKIGGYLAGGALIRNGSTAAALVRLDRSGALYTKFGAQGIYQRPAGGSLDTFSSIAFGAKAAIFAIGTTSTGSLTDNSASASVLVVSLGATGKPNKAFAGGQVVFAAPGFSIAAGQKGIVQADGKLLIVAALANSAAQANAGNFGAGLLRLTAKGVADNTIDGDGFTVVKAPSASTASSRRFGTLATPTIDGQAGTTGSISAPITLVQVGGPTGGKVRQIAADDAGADTTLTQTQLITDALDLEVKVLSLSNKKPYKFNAKVSPTLDVSNIGTLSSPSSVPVQIYQSTDSTLEIARDTLLAEVPAKVSLTPGKTKKIKIGFTAPATAGTYFYFARVNVGNGAVAEITLGNNLALPGNSIVVTQTGKPAAAAITRLAAAAPTTPIVLEDQREELFRTEGTDDSLL